MPFLEHLEELRWSIIWSLAALFFAIGFGLLVVLKFNVIALLERPLIPYVLLAPLLMYRSRRISCVTA
jgi:hypothetical protein